MLVTVEDDGADTQVNIWDLTEVSSSAPSTTPLGTVTLSGDATPTSVAACMGYIIVGSEDGISIIDPHSGSWAERTTGWPRSLSTSTTPALHDNDIKCVAAGLSNQPAFDPRTGGGMPSFGVNYGTGTKNGALIKEDGNVWDITGDGTNSTPGVGIHGGRLFLGYDSGQFRATGPIHTVTADQTVNPPNLIFYGPNDPNTPYNIAAAADRFSGAGNLIAVASGEGLGLNFGASRTGGINTQTQNNAAITRAYNSGYYTHSVKGIWLANSKTVDRSPKSNTLTENGTVTEAAVESGAELMGYSGFSVSNNLTRASDADWDVITTGAAYLSVWFKTSGNSAVEDYVGFGNAGDTIRLIINIQADGTVELKDDGATANAWIASTQTYDDGVWHKMDGVRVSSTERRLYVDGVQVNSSTTDAGSLSSSGNLPLGIGVNHDGNTQYATSSTLSLAHLSATAPSATQIRQMYDAEKPMFVASAECLLQSGSTDAVLDVDVDPLTGKVLVTQTDAITIFDGLAIDSKPTVNSGSSEKGKLWGALRAEQNSANAYVTAPAVDQRQVNEMVRGLASDLPAGPDLSKAAAWISFDGTGTISITASYNIKKIVDLGTGLYEIHFATLFKATNYVSIGSASAGSANEIVSFYDQSNKDGKSLIEVYVRNPTGTSLDRQVWCVFFGELENE
jgi:hypothetical protein